MLRHPALLVAQERRDTQCKALLAQQHVPAVAGVHAHNSIVLREMDNIPVLRVNVRLGVETLDKIVAHLLGHSRAHPGHDAHVQHHIDGVGQLNAVLGKGRSHHAHGIGNDIHGPALHSPGVQLLQLCVHLLGLHPVVGGTGIFLIPAADERAVLHSRHVVDRSAVQVAVRQLLLVELLQLAGGAGLGPQSVNLLL